MIAVRKKAWLALLSAAACAGLGLSALPAAGAGAATAAPGAGRAPAAAPGAGRPRAALDLPQRQVPLLDAVQRIRVLTHEGTSPGYSGYGNVTISVPAGLVTLYWKGGLPSGLRDLIARLRTGVRVRVLAAAYTWRQLEAQTRRLAARRAALHAAGISLSTVGPRDDASGLRAGVDYAASGALAAGRAADHAMAAQTALARRAVLRVDRGPAPVSVSDVPRVTTTGTRNDDNLPWWGGARIVRDGDYDCTSGFSIYNSAGANFMLTAGHCGGINTWWQTTDNYNTGGNLLGREINRDTGGDTAIIQVYANNPSIYDKGWDSTLGEQVLGARSATDGQSLCTEGATSGVRCAGTVRNTGLTVTLSNGETANNEVYATSSGQINAGGDSGGPVIQNSATPGLVYGIGTISASDTTVGCSNTLSMDPGVPWVCYKDVYFEDLPAALSHWHAFMR